MCWTPWEHRRGCVGHLVNIRVNVLVRMNDIRVDVLDTNIYLNHSNKGISDIYHIHLVCRQNLVSLPDTPLKKVRGGGGHLG